MFNSDSDSDSTVSSLGDTMTVVSLLNHDDELLLKARAKKFIDRLYPDEAKIDIGEANDDAKSIEAENSLKREDSTTMKREMSAADFLPSLPSFGKKKDKSATTDDGADLLKRLESEYIKAEDGERPRTVAVCPEPGSYPMHMRREYDTPVYAGGDDGEEDTLTTTGGTASPLLPRRSRRPTIVSHDVLMLVFSFLPPHLPTLRSVSATCRAWRERSEYLAPHWDIVGDKSRLGSYYTSQKVAWLRGDKTSDDSDGSRRASIDISREPSDITMDALRPRRNVAVADATLTGSDTASNRSDVSSTTAAIQAVAAAIRADEAAMEDPAVVDEDPAPDTDESSATSSAAAASAVVVPRPPPSMKLFKLSVGSRREFIIRRIQENYTMKEGISIIYRKKRLFGLYPLVIYLVWISFAAAVAFAMGYLPNALDTDVKIGVTFIFGIASLSGIAQVLSDHGCCLEDYGYRHGAYAPKPIQVAYRVWNLVSVGILCLVVALLAHRLAAVERLLDEQSYDANGVWSNDSAVSQYCPATANTTFPPALDFSPLSVGTSRYSWLSNRPLEVSFAYACNVKTSSSDDPISSNTATNVTTCFMNFTVLVAAYTNSLPTGCGNSNPARFIAFDVAGGINDTAALGTHDPLTYFAGGGAVHRGNTADRDGIQMKVPRDGDLFPIWVGWYIDVYRDYWYQPSTSSIGTNATVSYLWAETPNGIPGERNYDAAVSLSGVPWGDNTMPIVPYFGRGGVREMIDAYMRADGGAPKVSGLTYMFQSYNDLRDELIVGIWAVVGTALGGLFVLYATVWCFRFRHHHLREGPSVFWCNVTSKGVRVVFYVIAYLVCNPVMMLGFGTCYFKDPMPSYCMMSYPSALALFIVGVVFSCCCCIGTCGVLLKVCLS